jgi:CBS domain containing-hemolysin-like protein
VTAQPGRLNIFEFTDSEVRGIMVLRPEVTMLSSVSTVKAAAQEIRATGYSLYPVYASENRAQTLGIIYAKDIIRHLAENEGPGIRQVCVILEQMGKVLMGTDAQAEPERER